MDNTILKECLAAEVVGNHKSFTFFRLLHRLIKKPNVRFYFWFRIAQYLHKTGSRIERGLAQHIKNGLIYKYGADIDLDATIGPGLWIGHFSGIVITGRCTIGRRLHILQNTTIGLKHITGQKFYLNRTIVIGDDVEIGANSCLIGDNLHIGNNVTIGAMTFVNKDIPDNTLYYTEKNQRMVAKKKIFPSCT